MIKLGNSLAREVRPLFGRATITRTPNIGHLANDRSQSNKFSWPRYQASYKVDFPHIRMHIVEDVTLVDEYAAFCNGQPIGDHLITFMRQPNGSRVLAADTAERIGKAQARLGELEDVPLEDELTLIVHNEGGGTWGHWIAQALPKVVLFKSIYPGGKLALPQGYLGALNNFGLALELFGIRRDCIVPLARERAHRFRYAAFIDHMYVDNSVHPEAINILDGATLPPEEAEAGKRLFIGRTTRSPTREIANIDEAKQELTRFGFEWSELGEVPFAKQVSAWRSGEHFMSILGSDLTNIVFARPGAEIISVTPDYHGDMFFFDLAAAKGLKWHEILCGHIVEERNPRRNSSFSLDRTALNKFLQGVLG